MHAAVPGSVPLMPRDAAAVLQQQQQQQPGHAIQDELGSFADHSHPSVPATAPSGHAGAAAPPAVGSWPQADALIDWILAAGGEARFACALRIMREYLLLLPDMLCFAPNTAIFLVYSTLEEEDAKEIICATDCCPTRRHATPAAQVNVVVREAPYGGRTTYAARDVQPGECTCATTHNTPHPHEHDVAR